MSVLRNLRSELGAPLYTDWNEQRIICERGDLVRDLEVVEVTRDGRVVRVSPEIWCAYEHRTTDDHERPITTWEEVARVLGIHTATLHRQRRKAGHKDDAAFRSEAEVRRWHRDLLVPRKATTRKGNARKPMTLDDLINK